MKTKNKTSTKVIAIGLLVCGLILTSCKKGDTGPTGSNGTNGTNGVANIQTFVATTTNASWSLNGTEYDATITVSGITSTVVSNGSVMVFIGNTAQTSWEALPLSYHDAEYNYTYSAGQVILSVTIGNGGTPSNPGGLPFKVVVIPPAMVKPNVNIKNYSELKAAYNL